MKNEGLFDKITRARRVLELPENATMEEIRGNYKRLLKKWHPDMHNQLEKSHDMTKKIIWAYKIISDYCQKFRFPFAQEDVEKYISGNEWWFKRFGNDALWGR